MPHKKDKSVFTVQGIARETGLSPSLVPAVLSGRHIKRRIAPTTVEQVMAAAKRFHYVPNVAARGLRAKAAGAKYVVLSILTSYEAPVFLVTQALRAIEGEIARRGEAAANYKVNIEMYHAGCLDRLPGLIDGHRCNAAIATNTIDRDDQFLVSQKLPFPVVLPGRRIPGFRRIRRRWGAKPRKFSSARAGANSRCCSRRSSRRRPGTVWRRLSPRSSRRRDWRRIIICDNLQERAGYEAMKRFLASNPKCDGVFATTDSLAIGAYLTIKRSGRAIPGDIAMVGVGDDPASDFIDPPLTCFEHTEEALNQAVARLLLDLVNGTPPESLTIDVPVSPLLRESTGHTGKDV
jgi:LacI family transcriptional regulator